MVILSRTKAEATTDNIRYLNEASSSSGPRPKSHQGIRSYCCYFQKKIDRKEIGDQNQAIHASYHDQQQGIKIGLIAIMLEIIYRERVMHRLTKAMVNNINKLKTIQSNLQVDVFTEPGDILKQGTTGKNGLNEQNGIQ